MQEKDIAFNPGIAEDLKWLTDNGFLLIVISNQGGIGKGLYSIQQADHINSLISKHLEKYGVRFSEFYYCPHHPASGKCICRKPDSQLLEKAIARFQLQPENCIFIGDAERDVQAGEKAGVNSVRISPNRSLWPLIKEIVDVKH